MPTLDSNESSLPGGSWDVVALLPTREVAGEVGDEIGSAGVRFQPRSSTARAKTPGSTTACRRDGFSTGVVDATPFGARVGLGGGDESSERAWASSNRAAVAEGEGSGG